MQWMIDNWTLLASVFAALMLAAIKVREYLRLSAEAQAAAKKQAKDQLIESISGWLLYAITEAEREFGDGTGRLKIAEVYDKALERYPGLGYIITLEQLDELAQHPLEEMRRLLESNKAIAAYVSGGEGQE